MFSTAIDSAARALQSLAESIPWSAVQAEFKHLPQHRELFTDHPAAQVAGNSLTWKAILLTGLALQSATQTVAAKATDSLVVEFRHLQPKLVPNYTVVAEAIVNAFPGHMVHTLRIEPLKLDSGKRIPAYQFPRNIGIAGPGKMVVADVDSFQKLGDYGLNRAMTSLAIQRFLEANGIEKVVLPYPISLATLHFDPDLDLLVIAHKDSRPDDCTSSFYLHPSCKEETGQVITAFGTPKNLIQLVSDLDPKSANGEAECYDLDLYFHMATGREGQKVALVYKPCIAQRPPISTMSRENVLDQLRKLGVSIVGLSREDFLNLAANAVSPDPGTILFTSTVSQSLKDRLKAKGIDSVEPKMVLGNIASPVHSFFGVHCLTTELVPFARKPSLESTQRTLHAPGHEEL